MIVVHGGHINVLVAYNVGDKLMGSRFFILGKDIPNQEDEDLKEEKMMGVNLSQKITQNWQRKIVSLENIKRMIINGTSRKSAEFPYKIVSK